MSLLFGIVLISVLCFLNALPIAFLAMLFFGNIGWSVGFWQLVPGAMAIHFIKSNLITYTKGK